jgi:hypothetical protein
MKITAIPVAQWETTVEDCLSFFDAHQATIQLSEHAVMDTTSSNASLESPLLGKADADAVILVETSANIFIDFWEECSKSRTLDYTKYCKIRKLIEWLKQSTTVPEPELLAALSDFSLV